MDLTDSLLAEGTSMFHKTPIFDTFEAIDMGTLNSS